VSIAAPRIDVTAAEYHADPAPEPSLSSSIAKLLLDRSPRHARLAHPRLGGVSGPGTPTMDRGTLIHLLVLGKGSEIEVIDADDWRPKWARDARDAAREAGKLPVLSGALVDAAAAATAIKRELTAGGVLLDGDSEVAMLWQEEAEQGAIWCRGMVDHMVPVDGRLCLYDLKTIHSAHPDDCTRSAINFGYDIQQEAYTRGAELTFPGYAGRVEFRFLFAEAEPPYGVTVATLDALMQQRGRRRWAEAVQTWSRCLATDEWPGYAREPVTLWSPGWLLQRESEAAEARGEALEL